MTTNPKPNVLEYAKQGNPKAIAALINRQLQPKGIIAKVSLKDNLLRIVLDSNKKLNKALLTEYIEKSLNKLQPININRVEIYSRNEEDEFDWNYSFSLQNTLSVQVKEDQSIESEQDSQEEHLDPEILIRQEHFFASLLYDSYFFNSDNPFVLKAKWSSGFLHLKIESKSVPSRNDFIAYFREAVVSSLVVLLKSEATNEKHKEIKEYFRLDKVEQILILLHESNNHYPNWCYSFDISFVTKFYRESFRCTKLLSGHLKGVNSVAFDPAGLLLASSSNDKTVKIWKVSSGEITSSLEGHMGLMAGVYSVCFNSIGTLLASGSDDKTIKLWQVESGTPIRSFVHGQGVRKVAISPDNRFLASVSTYQDQKVKLWDIESGSLIATFEEGVLDVAFTPDGRYLCSPDADSGILLWDIENLGSDFKYISIGDQVKCFSFSSNGQYLATGNEDGTIHIWDFDSSNPDDANLIHQLPGHKNMVTAIAFHPFGDVLASSDIASDNSIKIWDIHAGLEITSLAGHSGSIKTLSFDPYGSKLASGSDDKSIMIWSFE